MYSENKLQQKHCNGYWEEFKKIEKHICRKYTTHSHSTGVLQQQTRMSD